MIEVVLRKPKPGAFRPGHPWVYRSQIGRVGGKPAPGDLVAVSSASGRFLGTGYFNDKSEITVRILTRDPGPIDKDFFLARMEKAAALRQRFVKDTNAFRLVSSEADDLPGLIVDRYGEVLVVQFLTCGMDRLREPALLAARAVFSPSGIYERSDSSSRRLEGLEARTGWVEQHCGAQVVVQERGIRARVSFGEGHKTGWYLDQRENRCLLADLAGGGEALDVFCYEGGFGLHLASRGVKVLGIDIQEEAVKRGEEHRRLNGIPEELLQFQTANAFDALRSFEKEKKKFDLVILDPPSFVKKKSAIEGAVAGYKELLLRSMKLAAPGGLLAVFSCSYHVDESLLMQIAMSAALDAHKTLKVIRFLKQSADHPVNPFIPETYYLKGFLFSVS
ncbi:MAG: class I SAM-dependent rRNA methyltransferase [Candidatus Omnitrophica bacterium]|nr:class I SAM-dependent rRNA methyltransferase [Candidatus Omnitrophota bacterium]